MESKVDKAVELFKEGFNCSQSVVAAYAEDYGLTREQALKIAASFGGGIGRMRQTCGAACGLFMLAGLETGCTDGKSREGKEDNYRTVQMLAQEFKRRNGSIICAELLGLAKQAPTPPTPEERTPEYFKKRPCVKMVEEAARIWEEYLDGKICPTEDITD